MRPPDNRDLARRGRLPAAVFLACAFLLLPLAMLGQRTYVAVDMLEPTAPYRDALARPPHVVSIVQTDQAESTPGPVAFFRALRRGVFQRWDPNLAAGNPTGILPLNGVLSPFSVGWLFLPAWYAVSLKVFLALLCSQAFTYLLVRRLGAAVGPSVLAGVAYTFSGTNLVLVHRVDVVFLAPALFWATSRLVARPERRGVALLAVLVAFGWFQGFPSGWVFCLYAVAAWGAWLAVRAGPGLARAARRLLPVAGALAWGVALSAVNLVPFLAEVLRRGTLEVRSATASHIPAIQLFGLFDLSATGPPVGGPWWSGLNPVESVSHVGTIAALAVAAGLVAAALGRLRLSREGADAWAFFCGVAVVGVVVTFVGTPLLDVVSRLPGVARNPIGRARFLVSLAVAVLGALALDGWWRARSDGVRPSRLGSLAALAVLAGATVFYLPDFARAASGANQLRGVTTGFARALAVALVAAGVAVVARRRPDPRVVTGAVLALVTLLFAQLAWPLRAFTPQAPVADFYPEEAGHRALERLLAGRYRFTASDLNFYPNSGQVQGLADLRGLALHSKAFKALVGAANPSAFSRDPLKILLRREEWNLTSPVLDDLAVRYFAEATTEIPFGRVVQPDLDWDRWAPVDSLGDAVTGTAPGPVDGMYLPLRASGRCQGAQVRVGLVAGGREVAATTRAAFDVDGGWTGFALLGQSLREGDAYRLDLSTTRAGCRLLAGVTGPRLARQVLVEDPGQAVRLVSTEQAWVYERPGAWELVSAHPRWRQFPDQTALLAWAAHRPAEEADVAGFVGAPPRGVAAAPRAGPKPAVSYRVGDNSVRASTRGEDAALVVVSQNRSDGWTARVDGRAAPVVAVDGALMGVFVPPGDHTVVLRYLPRTFVAGSAISLAALVAVGVAVVPARRRRGRGVRVG